MDADHFLRDVGKHIAHPGDRHYAAGWTNTPCPFCTGLNKGNHLGHDGKDPWICWRCGPHSSAEVVKELLGLDSWAEAYRVVRDYKVTVPRRPDVGFGHNLATKRLAQAALPLGAGPMSKRHTDYLASRQFDPTLLESQWGLLGTGPAGRPPLRVVAPITLKGVRISWQARDITGLSDRKYLACPKYTEVIDHHMTLYGLDKVPGHECILVEGITDVWRIGAGAVASFGQKIVPAQLLLLCSMDRVAVFLDHDAAESAEKIAHSLSVVGVEVELWTPDASKDPGELDQSTADCLSRAFFQTRV